MPVVHYIDHIAAKCKIIRDRPFNLKGGGGLCFFVSFRIFFSDNTRVRILIFFVALSANFFPDFNIRLLEKSIIYGKAVGPIRLQPSWPG